MKLIHVELTKEQAEQLKPMFDAVIEANKKGESVAIAAQVWRDGFSAKLLLGNECTALASALGGAPGAKCSSVSEKMGIDP